MPCGKTRSPPFFLQDLFSEARVFCQVLIFSDDIDALHLYSGTHSLLLGDAAHSLACHSFADALGLPFMHGGTPQKKRADMYQSFKTASGGSVLLLSQVGDVAVDLPEASVIIQVSSHFGSRRQEAQRFGRILRAKS